MKIVFVASELAPLAKVGGLADVVGSLPRALRRLGHDVAILAPLYGTIDRERFRLRKTDFHSELRFDGRNRPFALWRARVHGVPVILVESDDYFSGRGIYGEGGSDYPDNAFRFAFFARAAIAAIRELHDDADVVHVHDWQTALVPVYSGLEEPLGPTVALTVHNLAYQGVFPREWLERLGLPPCLFHMEGLEFYGKISFLKGGLVTAGAITTVSPRYAREIQTPELGCGLEGVTRARAGELRGILNGIEPSEWSPAKDRALETPFGPTRLGGKEANKLALQRELGLEVKARTPLVGVIGRLDHQKGFDLLLEAAPFLLEAGAQLVVLGSGNPAPLRAFERLKAASPRALATEKGFREELGRRIYAGSDLFLMPSRYEPCGLGQLIALRYGSLPLVRETGGLADTIRDLDEDPERGNGFVFREFDLRALQGALRRALDRYRDEKQWRTWVARAMRQDFSWKESARRYEEVYREAIERRVGG